MTEDVCNSCYHIEEDHVITRGDHISCCARDYDASHGSSSRCGCIKFTSRKKTVEAAERKEYERLKKKYG